MSEQVVLGRREQNKVQTRQRLIDAARSLLAEAGTAATVEEIADRAEVSRATFFNYFPSKDHLVTALYQVHMEHLAELVDRLLATDCGTDERILAIFRDFIRSLQTLPGYLVTATSEFERLTNGEITRARHQLFVDQLTRVTERGIADGEVRNDHSPQFLARMIAAIYVSTVRDHDLHRPETFVDEFVQAAHFAYESVAAR